MTGTTTTLESDASPGVTEQTAEPGFGGEVVLGARSRAAVEAMGGARLLTAWLRADLLLLPVRRSHG
jgi:hypothetical protein